jgi:hypothetical protein
VSGGLLVIALAVGAALIALWVDVRFPSLEPSKLQLLIAHVAVATVVGRIAVPLAIHSSVDSTRLALLTAVFGVAFPLVVYNLLAGLWMLKLVQRTFAGHMR